MELSANLAKTCRNLELFGTVVKHFATGAEAADYLLSEITGTTVGIGGSKTVDQLGIYDRLKETNEVTWHWKDGFEEDVYRRASEAKVYLCSPNAVAETGEMIFIDGRGNRVSALTTLIEGKRVYLPCSVKKICPDAASAIARARSISPANLARFTDALPCQKDGQCHDCRDPQRMCRAFLALCGNMGWMEKIEAIFIDEDLGL